MERASIGRWGLVLAAYSAFFTAFFWPVLAGGRFLAFGDGLSQWLPMYFGPHRLWEPNLMLGYPLFANPEQFWYPLTALRAVAGSFNAYVVSAYVIAACGAYGLVRSETGSNYAGAAGGLIYALSGFMIAHLQHLDIIHPAAWAPVFLLALRSLRRGFSTRWLVVGSIALGLCILGGQPQIAVYTAILGLILCARNLVAALACVACGTALAAIVLIPGAELASRSVRATMPFYQFAPGVALTHIPVRLLFPYLLGGSAMAAYPHSDFALDPFVEQSNYVGIVTLALVLAAIRSFWASGSVRLWTAIAGAALILTSGNDLGVAAVTYHIPLLDLFRSQGRHAFEFALATSVLAGFAIAGLERGAIRARDLARTCGFMAIPAGLVLALVAATQRFALERYVAQFTAFQTTIVDPLANPAVAIPLLALALGGAVFALVARHPAPLARIAVVAVLAVDMTSFAWFAYWHWAPLPHAALDPPPYASMMRATLSAAGQREFVLEVPGAASPLRPNANLLWDIPSAWASFALLPSRSAALLQSVRSDFFGQRNAAQIEDPADQSFDLAAIRFVVAPGSLPVSRPIDRPWDEGYDWGRRIGSKPLEPLTTFRFHRPRTATGIALVTSLGLAASIPDRAVVATIVVVDVAGRRLSAPLLAGRDTAEMAYDRFDVRPRVRHALAPVYSSDGSNHRYVATVTLPRRVRIERIDVLWSGAGDRDASLLIDKLSLLDRSTQSAVPVSPMFLLRDDPSRLRALPIASNDVVLENSRVFPRAWIARRVIPSTAGAALDAVRSSAIDFHQTALVEGAAAYDGTGGDARIADMTSGRMRVEVACAARCFLVTSDPVYPGWTARVDGNPVPLYAADYALRGTFVPAGRHVVEFGFFSRSLALGSGVTLAACLALAGLCLRSALLQRRAQADEKAAFGRVG
jgi:hypothetical protein